MIAREARLVVAAAAFLTRLPVPHARAEHCARYFPLVGACIGAFGGLVTIAAARIVPLVVAVILGMIATALLTGALHEDGLADSADAFGGGATREQVLTIMRDSRIGAFGALGLILVLALKIASLSYLPLAALPLGLVCAHAFSRALCVAPMAYGRYARSGHPAQRARPADAAIALVLGALPFFFLSLWPIVAMLAVAAVLYAYFHARIGGYTGDALGALQQLTEVACYVALLAVL